MAVDDDLIAEVEAAFQREGSVVRLSDEEALAHLQRLAARLQLDAAQRWWWESRSGSLASVRYYGSEDGLTLIERVVAQEGDVLFFVTDDQPPPWPAFRGHQSELLKALRECRMFEFFLAGADGSWIVFDTHMNEVIGVGSYAVV